MDLLVLVLMLPADVSGSSGPLAGDDVSVIAWYLCVPPSDARRNKRGTENSIAAW
eukprot:COSAG01_NODE_1056_length_11893_cov_439.683332_6_plen_55_part_00